MKHQKIKDSGTRQEFSTGAVQDADPGKPRFDLISPIFSERLAYWLTLGGKKYQDRNWEKGIPLGCSLASLYRHLHKWVTGQKDEDHLAAAACRLMFIIHTEQMIIRGGLPANLNDIPDYGTFLAGKFPYWTFPVSADEEPATPGPWIETYTGKKYSFLNPRVDQIDAVDIAHALSKICRFTGHTKWAYSVGQHCLLVSAHLSNTGYSNPIALAGLLHDAPEAYVSDLSSPLKSLLPIYRDIEASAASVVEERYGLLPGALNDPRVEDADRAVTERERVEVLGGTTWQLAPAKFPCDFPKSAFMLKSAQDVATRYMILLSTLRGGNG